MPGRNKEKEEKDLVPPGYEVMHEFWQVLGLQLYKPNLKLRIGAAFVK